MGALESSILYVYNAGSCTYDTTTQAAGRVRGRLAARPMQLLPDYCSHTPPHSALCNTENRVWHSKALSPRDRSTSVSILSGLQLMPISNDLDAVHCKRSSQMLPKWRTARRSGSRTPMDMAGSSSLHQSANDLHTKFGRLAWISLGIATVPCISHRRTEFRLQPCAQETSTFPSRGSK
jgi:hypothetical protein